MVSSCIFFKPSNLHSKSEDRRVMIKKIKNKCSHLFLCFLTSVSPKLNFEYRYRKNIGKKMEITPPKTFNEKIIWLELNKYINDSLVVQCSDKYKVREYVQSCGCDELLIPHIGVWDNPISIVWDELPERFVLKWNFGAGFNYICTDKSSCDREIVIKQMQKWGKSKYWLWYGEMHYKKIPKKIICEQYISNLNKYGENKNYSPEDYKFYCFNGKVKYVLLCLNRKGMHADYVFFDPEWNVQPFSAYAIHNKGKINIERPKLLDLAIKYAEKLALPFPYVRVDLYILSNQIYFGELTFTPCGGVDSDLYEGDTVMGDLLDISRC